MNHYINKKNNNIFITLYDKTGACYTFCARFKDNKYLFHYFPELTDESFLDYMIHNELCEYLKLEIEKTLGASICYYTLTQKALLEAI